jgi:cytochrome c oxidase subunit 2
MLATVKVVTPEEYKKFIEGADKCQGTPEECLPEKWGKDLFVKNGCTSCHGQNGSGEFAPGAKTPGPKLAGIFGTPQPLTTGAPVVADENYLRESILRPNAKVVAGYATVPMPPFVLKDPQLDAVIAYIKSLK